jgi:hypothetical protein
MKRLYEGIDGDDPTFPFQGLLANCFVSPMFGYCSGVESATTWNLTPVPSRPWTGKFG